MSIHFDSSRPIKIDKNALKKLAIIDADTIIKTAKAYVEADVSMQPGGNTYTVLQQEDVFARVGVGAPEGGGFWVLLKKVNDIWVPLLAGQDLPSKDIGQKYGLPEGWYSKD